MPTVQLGGKAELRHRYTADSHPGRTRIMLHVITGYTTVYAPWEEHDDEPAQTDAWVDVTGVDPDEYDVDNGETAVTLAIQFLRERCNLGWDAFSDSDWREHGWYVAESYSDPYTGETTEGTFHLDGFTAEESRTIYLAVTVPVVRGVRA